MSKATSPEALVKYIADMTPTDLAKVLARLPERQRALIAATITRATKVPETVREAVQQKLKQDFAGLPNALAKIANGAERLDAALGDDDNEPDPDDDF